MFQYNTLQSLTFYLSSCFKFIFFFLRTKQVSHRDETADIYQMDFKEKAASAARTELTYQCSSNSSNQGRVLVHQHTENTCNYIETGGAARSMGVEICIFY